MAETPLNVLWLALACLIINGGEMIVFAFGAGDCMFLWLLLGFCHFYVDPAYGPARPARPAARGIRSRNRRTRDALLERRTTS